MNKFIILFVFVLTFINQINSTVPKSRFNAIASKSRFNSTVPKSRFNAIASKNQINDYDVKKKIILTSDAPKPIGPYNQAIQVNYMLYLSGQIGINPATGQLISDDVKNQTQQVFRNIQAVLHAAGSDLTQIARCLVLLTDMNDFQTVNQIYASYFPSMEDYPARTTFAVKTLPANAKVEIECTAFSKME